MIKKKKIVEVLICNKIEQLFFLFNDYNAPLFLVLVLRLIYSTCVCLSFNYNLSMFTINEIIFSTHQRYASVDISLHHILGFVQSSVSKSTQVET